MVKNSESRARKSGGIYNFEQKIYTNCLVDYGEITQKKKPDDFFWSCNQLRNYACWKRLICTFLGFALVISLVNSCRASEDTETPNQDAGGSGYEERLHPSDTHPQEQSSLTSNSEVDYAKKWLVITATEKQPTDVKCEDGEILSTNFYEGLKD